MDKLKNFLLPSFIDDDSNHDDDHLLIEQIETHIKKLKIEKVATEVLNLFELYPNIKSMIFTIYFTVEINFYDNTPKTQKEEIDEALFNHVTQYKYVEEYNDFFYSLAEEELNSNNIKEKVAKAMGEEHYQAWIEMIKVYQEKKQLENKLLNLDNTSSQSFKELTKKNKV